MNAERLHAIARAVMIDWSGTQAPLLLGQLADALQSMVNQPQQPQYQQQVSDALAQLRGSAADSAATGFPATWVDVLQELGLTDLLTPAIVARSDSLLAQNQMTPSVALSELQSLVRELGEAESALQGLLSSFEHLALGSEELDPGTAEMAVLIPRPAVGNDLPDLGREFVQLQQLVDPFMEAATGSREPLQVNAISSSDFGVYLEIAPQVGAFVAVAVERVVHLYKTLLEVRRLRQELADQGVPSESTAGIEEHANRLMGDGIEEFADSVDLPAVSDPGRQNELRLEIRLSMNAVANRIDRGYNIDVRAAAAAPEDESSESSTGDDDVAIGKILDLTPRLKFISPVGRPMLSLNETPHQEGPDPDAS